MVDTSKKDKYEKPQLNVHGKVKEFTKGGMQGGSDLDDGLH